MQKWIKQFWFISLIPLIDIIGRILYVYIMNGHNISLITDVEDKATRIYCICSLLLPIFLFEFIKKIVEPKAKFPCLFWQIIITFKIMEEFSFTPTEFNIINIILIIPAFFLCKEQWDKNFKSDYRKKRQNFRFFKGTNI